MPVGEAQEFDGLNTQHFAGHALLPLARQHEIGIDKARNLTALRAVCHHHPNDFLALLCPQGACATHANIIIVRMRPNHHRLVIGSLNHL